MRQLLDIIEELLDEMASNDEGELKQSAVTRPLLRLARRTTRQWLRQADGSVLAQADPDEILLMQLFVVYVRSRLS